MKRRKHPAGTLARYVVQDPEMGKAKYFALSTTADFGVLICPSDEENAKKLTTIFPVYDPKIVKAARARGFNGRWVPVKTA
jgi:hypothetical protein